MRHSRARLGHVIVMLTAYLLDATIAVSAPRPAEAEGGMARFLPAGKTLGDLTSGRIDAQPVISAAIDADTAVILPCGSYHIKRPFTDWHRDGTRLSGISNGCVRLIADFAIADGAVNIFHLSGHNQTISDMMIVASRVMTAGAAIYLDSTFNDTMENLVFEGPFWNGIYIYGSNNTHLAGLTARPPFMPGTTLPNPQNGKAYAGRSFIALNGDPSTGKITIDSYIRDINIAQYQYGIEYIYASGIYADAIDIVGARTAHIFDPDTRRNVNGVQMTNVLGDTSYEDNWRFPESGGGVFEVMCTNCWASSSYTGSGFTIENTKASQLSFSNSSTLNNARSGLVIRGGTNISWSYGAIELNNTDIDRSATQSSDVLIAGKVDGLRIQDTFIGRGGVVHNLLHKNYRPVFAIEIDDNADVDHLLISGIQSSGHRRGALHIPPGKTGINIRAAIGD